MEDGSTSSSIFASGTDGAVDAGAAWGDGTGCSSLIRLFGDSMRFRRRFLHKFPKTKVLKQTGKVASWIKPQGGGLLTG